MTETIFTELNKGAIGDIKFTMMTIGNTVKLKEKNNW